MYDRSGCVCLSVLQHFSDVSFAIFAYFIGFHVSFIKDQIYSWRINFPINISLHKPEITFPCILLNMYLNETYICGVYHLFVRTIFEKKKKGQFDLPFMYIRGYVGPKQNKIYLSTFNI